MSQAFSDRIPYSDELLRGIESQLTPLLGFSKNTLRFNRKPAQSNTKTDYISRFFCEFTSVVDGLNGRKYTETYTEPGGRNQQWTVAKVIRAGASTAATWIGCRLTFDTGTGPDSYYLTSVSLLFLAYEKDFFPLLRAEWDYRGFEEEKAHKHGQPHWHMLTSLQAASISPQNFDGPIDFTPQTDLQNQGIESLHLAMGADWHEINGVTHRRLIQDKQALKNWVIQTVKYGIVQIEYALNNSIRNTTGQTAKPVDFAPQSVQ